MFKYVLYQGLLQDLDMLYGKRKRHIFFALAKVFRWEYATLVLSLVIQVFASFAAPLALNRILKYGDSILPICYRSFDVSYIEHGAVGMSVRPWFWVCLLFVGPMISSVTLQWYIHLVVRILVPSRHQ